MFDFNWRHGFTIGITLGGCVAILVIIFLVGLDYCPDQPCNEQQAPDNPKENANQSIWQVPDTFRSTFSYKSEPEYTEGNPTRYEYYDLLAQERVAHATDWIAWITLISSMLGVFGLGAIVYTLHLQRYANTIAQAIGQAQVRAYVAVKSIRVIRRSFFFEDKAAFDLEIELANTGQSPARDIAFGLHLDNRGYHDPKDSGITPLNYRNFHLGAGSTIVEETGVLFQIGQHNRLYVDTGRNTKPPGPNTVVFLEGVIEYTDCFNVRRRFDWSYVFKATFMGGIGIGLGGHMQDNFIVRGEDTSFLNYHHSSEEQTVKARKNGKN